MMIRKVFVGTALAAGLGVAGLFGTIGTAAAAPGISYSDNGNDPVGFGDNSTSGAQSSASEGNRSLAVSVFGASRADANGPGTGNTAIAVDGIAGINKGNNNTAIAIFGGAGVNHGDNNNVVAVGGSAFVNKGSNNNVLAVGGSAVVPFGNGNNVAALGSNVNTEDADSQTVVALCGKSIVSAQSSSVEVSAGACGGS